MKAAWKAALRQIESYIPGEQPKNKDIIKLNANENPYPPSPKAISAIKDFSFDTLRLYPDANATPLKSAIAVHFGVAQNQVSVGNGSDEILAFIYMACFNSSKPIIFPDITYSFYPVWCDLYNTPYRTIPLLGDFSINAKDYHCENGGILLPNPNAPTGMGQTKEALIDILNHNQASIVVIDEAYVDFGAYSAVDLLAEYENLLIVQTFSKSRSLAGMRIGLALGSPIVIQTLEAVKNSYNSYTCDSLAIAAGAAAIADNAYFLEVSQKIQNTRGQTATELADLGFVVYPSQSNFLFVTHPHIEAKVLFLYLREKNIFIRHFDLPRINNHLRITMGTPENMACLVDEIKKYFSKLKK